MSRLTKWWDSENGLYGATLVNGVNSQTALTKLAAYEDMLPEPNMLYGVSADRIRELIEADKSGRCVVLPCKVGDTIFVDTRTFLYGDRNGRRHAEGLVTSFVYGHRNFINFHIFSPYVNANKVFKYPLSAFGVTVFLTREEAEEAPTKEVDKQ